MPAKNKQYKLSRPVAYLTRKDVNFMNGEKATWWVGTIKTVYGIVGVYRQSGDDAHTSFSFVRDGISYQRDFDKYLSDRFLVTAGVRFAREVNDAK